MFIKNKEKKLFIFDLDGTLLNSSLQLSKHNYQAIIKARNKKHLIVIATGRSYLFAQEALKDVWNIFDYYIGCNGALLHDIQNKQYYEIPNKIDIEFLKQIQNEVKEIGGVIQVSTSWNTFCEVFISNSQQWFADKNELDNFKKWDSIDKMTKKELKQIIQISVHLESHKISEINNEWIKNFGDKYDFAITSQFNIDINVKNINKLFRIKQVVETNCIDPDNVFVFGDTQNDIPGIKYFNKNSFAMSNALDEVKKCAKYVIGNNDSDSIAKVVLNNI